MHADRVNVFHAADSDDIALAIPDHLKLDFFPSRDTFLYQDLAHPGKAQPVDADIPEFFQGMGYAAAGAAQGIGRAHHDRVPDALCKFQGIFQGVYYFAGDAWLPDPEHGVLELLPVLRHPYGINGSP